MKSLAEQMSVYAAYHRDPVNKGIHFIFVPAIVWTVMIALDHVPVAGPVSAAFLVTGALLVWYVLLDLRLGLAAAMLYTVLLVAAVTLNDAVSLGTSLAIAGGVHVASWAFQFLGHGVWEKRRPALADNLFQVLVAPIFVLAEIGFAMGLRKDLEADVERLMVAHLPEAEKAGLVAA
ncbi:MAG: DUF962 domain-containing protein [Thermoplasmatota archaeon]